MVRATNAVYSNRKRKRLMKQAKGFQGDRRAHRRLTSNAVLQAMAFNYVGRKQCKRDFRSLWITRLNVASKINGISYSQLIHGLTMANYPINRKILSQLSIDDPAGFAAIAEKAKAHVFDVKGEKAKVEAPVVAPIAKKAEKPKAAAPKVKEEKSAEKKPKKIAPKK